MHSLFHRNDGKTGFLLTAGADKAALPTVIQRSIITLHGKLIMENDGSVLKRTFDWIPAFEAVQKSSLGRVTGGKPLRVWLFYWVPAFAGTTILGFLHSLFRGCAKILVRLRWWKTQPPKSPLSGGLSTQFPPDKGGFPLNSPLIRGARGVKNDERWVSCTVSFAGTTILGFLHSLASR